MSNPRLRKDPGAPPVGKQEEADNFLQKALRSVGDGFGAVDDAYMGFMRDQVLRLPQEGRVKEDGFAREVRDTLGGAFFQARPGATGVNPNYQGLIENGGDRAAMFANRALHAGGITAAGAGLIELGGAVAHQFGGPADGQTDSQLYMS